MKIIEDINQYVPVQGGDSRNGGGGRVCKVLLAYLVTPEQPIKEKLTIRWDTPYAQYQNKGEVMKGRPGPTRTYGPEKLRLPAPWRGGNGKNMPNRSIRKSWALAVEKGIKQRLE